MLKPRRKLLIATIPIFVRIEPLMRPRATRAGGFNKVYQPKTNQQALYHSLKEIHPLGISYPVIVDTYVNFVKPPSSKLSMPTGKRYGDDDNLRKALADALVHTKILADDSIIVGGENFKLFGPEDSALVVIYSVDSAPVEVMDGL